MRYKVPFYVFTIFLLTLIQSTLLQHARVFEVKPNLLLVFIVAVALLRGNTEGAVVGLFAGLMQDMVSGGVLGFYALLGMYTGLIVGSLNRKLYRENLLIMIFFTSIVSVIYEFLVYFFYKLGVYISGGFVAVELELYSAMLLKILPEAAYNCIAAIFIFLFTIRFHRKFLEHDNLQRRY